MPGRNILDEEYHPVLLNSSRTASVTMSLKPFPRCTPRTIITTLAGHRPLVFARSSAILHLQPPNSGPRGRRFKSCHPDLKSKSSLHWFAASCFSLNSNRLCCFSACLFGSNRCLHLAPVDDRLL